MTNVSITPTFKATVLDKPSKVPETKAKALRVNYRSLVDETTQTVQLSQLGVAKMLGVFGRIFTASSLKVGATTVAGVQVGITANSVEKPRLEGLAQKVDNTEIVLGKEWHGLEGDSYFAHPLFGMDLRTEN